ncbi:pseudouridine synthase pus4 [Marasmius crinis-equi]|uniref:tRNA pseudouridine(55) synthase n=1 Tax=Marasmius crinis-equi TaxID=585013 RepID=A0ABR3G133_9AGAR
MPKATIPPLPMSGLFGLIKPSGPTSMSLRESTTVSIYAKSLLILPVNSLQPLFSKSRLFAPQTKPEDAQPGNKAKRRRMKRGGDVKLGQGGTLDPLADGVLGTVIHFDQLDPLIAHDTVVLGVGKGTKKLTQFLDCTKEYRTTCLLGCETDSYDSEGAIVRNAPWKHVTKEAVEEALAQFTGEIKQTPPIFSALKMDGRPLYEYARKGIPLPRPIEARSVTVHSLKIEEWLGSSHTYKWPQKSLSEDEKKAMEKAIQGVDESATIQDQPEESKDDEVASAFVLSMKVSGGTYVRSVVHDLAHSLGSAGHVVTLTRSRQGRFVLGEGEPETEDRRCIPWEVFEKAVSGSSTEADEDGWCEWEREVLQHIEIIEEK